jgi:hypothetical protein
MANPAEALARHLDLLKILRGEAKDTPGRLPVVKRWQAGRLADTYADLAESPRYKAATSFFLEDLYGPKDFSSRDDAMMKILPVMSRVLPASAVETAALAIELEALSEDLDHRLARALPPGTINAASYAQAYRASGTRAQRERQIELVDAVGRRLDALVARPFVSGTLKLMRQPARLAGLSDLQDFLERGFEAFRRMRGAGEFLDLVRERETRILNELFSAPQEASSA